MEQAGRTGSEYLNRLKNWYETQYQATKTNRSLSTTEKRQAYAELAGQRKADFAQQKAQAAERRKSIREANPLLTWQAFLQEAAVQGNTEALAILRSRKKSQRRLVNAILSAESLDEAKHIIYAHLYPKPRKNGDMVYSVF